MNEKSLLTKPFRHYMRAHPRAFVLGVISLFFTNIFDVMTPLAIKAGIDSIENKNLDGLWAAVGAYVGLMVGVTIFRFAWRINFGKFHHSVADDLRNRIFSKLTTLGPSYFSRKPVGELMSLVTADVNAFRQAIGPGVLILLDAVFLIAFILPLMIMVSWDWTWKTLILLPFVPFLMRHMERLIHDRFRAQQDRLAEVSASAQEIVSGIRVIKSFAQEKNQARLFNDRSAKFEMACNQVAKVDGAFHPAMDVTVALGAVTLLYFCTPAVVRGEITLGTFVAFHEYIKRMIWPMSAIGFGMSTVEQGKASFGKIAELLSVETDIPDTGTVRVDKFDSLEIRDLSFRYPESPSDALSHVSLKVHAGETIGVVGPVGAGKSTLLQVLCRMYPTEPGRVLLNGRDLSEYSRASLSETVSLVPQDAFLFSDTISDNIAYGVAALFPELVEVERVSQDVNMDGEIRGIPEGYSAHLGERGVNLSGGQKQRLTIARALIRRSSVLLLDDSLSAVDGKTEKAIVTAFQRARAENPTQTVVIVSHRLATLKHADRIVVLNRGVVEAIGSHEELLTLSSTYRHLDQVQSGAGTPVDELVDQARLAEGGLR